MYRKHDDYLRDRQARVRLWLSQGTDAEIVGGICDNWVRELVEGGHRPNTGRDIPGLPTELNLVIRFADAGLAGFSSALAWMIDVKVGVEPAEAPLIGHALAKAAGRAYATYGPNQLDWICSMVSTVDHQSWETFADFAAAALHEDTNKRDNFVNFLVKIIQTANESPDAVTEYPDPRTSVALLSEQYAQTGNFQAVWQVSSSPVLFRWGSTFEIFRRVDPNRFVDLIDDLRHPALVAQCLCMRRLVDDAEATLQLLRIARTSFDAEGRWQQHGVAAILLLQMASSQLLAIKDDGEDDAPTVGLSVETGALHCVEKRVTLAESIAEFKKSVDNLLDVLFTRPDGGELGWHWLENLLRQLPRQRPRRGDQMAPDYQIDYLGILIHALSSRLVPRRALSSWISEMEPPWRQYRGVAVLSVAGFSSAAGSPDIGTVALELLKRNDMNLLGTKEQIELPGAPLRIIPGCALARIPTVALWFTQTWRALRLEREQAWRRRSGGTPVANPAEIMGFWGLGIIEALAMAEIKPSNPQVMWQALEITFREARLVEPRMGRDFWTQAVARLFAWWVPLFMPQLGANSDETASDISNALGDALAPYIGISADFMAIIARLHGAGVAVTVLDRAVSNAKEDLLRMVRRFFDTAPRLKDAQLWNQEWVAALRMLERAISLERLGNKRTPT